jgi:hypothetical protein
VPLLVAVAQIISRQRGVIARHQALNEGMTARQIEYCLKTGEWVLVCRGIYRVATTPLTFQSKVVAALLHAGAHAVASHTTAGFLAGLEGIRPGRIEISVQRGHCHSNPLAVVHQVRHLPRSDVRIVDGVRCTSVARTLADLAGRVSEAVFIEAFDGAVVSGAAKLSALRDVMGRTEDGPGRSGGGVFRRALALWDDGRPLAETLGEARLLRALLSRGFRSPERQYEIWVDGRLLGRADFAYPPERVLLEYDGKRRHIDPNRDRENSFVAAGWRVLTATKGDVHPRATRLWRQLARFVRPG